MESFYNDGGTIKVGANNKQLITQILDSKAVGVFAKDSNVYFNAKKGNTGLTGETSLISLEGQKFMLHILRKFECLF